MPRSAFDSSVTITLTGDSGEELRCSALLERDPGFLQWNRISLLGNRDDYISALRLHDDQEVRWELHNDPNWPHGVRRKDQHHTSGTATFRSIGMAAGIAIAPDSIQKFADLNVFQFREHSSAAGWQGPAVEYWFLQRPRGWHAYPRRLRQTESLIRRGDWVRVAGSDLKFRLLSTGLPRNDRRLSKEIELIEVPGVEIRPRRARAPEAFVEQADDLWFSLRILIAFRFRLYPATLAEFRETPGGYEQIWHPVSVEPRVIAENHDDPPLYGAVDRFFARGAATLGNHKTHRQVLHAAAIGYANSYKAVLLESSLTSCVEAIERLVTAFELSSSLEREVLQRSKWRKVADTLKKAIDEMPLDEATARLVKRSLAKPPTMSLEERVHRMIEVQSKHWTGNDHRLLDGLGHMIKVRNDIVHGRLVDDINEVYVELIRARAVFERLFLRFLKCHGFACSGFPQLIIADYEQRRSEAESVSADGPR